MMEEAACVFCTAGEERFCASNTSAFVVRDAYPVTAGHTLVISRRHVETWFQLNDEERNDINKLLIDQRNYLSEADASIAGFNIGINCGYDAGQTVMHCHVHLIPRRVGDISDPRGGIRAVIPNNKNY